MTQATLDEELARRIRLVVLDVDGVLTDNGVYIGRTAVGDGIELKRFHIQDGLGMKLLEWAGVGVVLLSGRESPATASRAAELGLEAHQDAGARKRPIMERILERRGIGWDEVAMVADDLADLPVLSEVALPVAVANAVPEVRDAAVWTTARVGGDGAVREFSEALLRARGEWDAVLQGYARYGMEGGEVADHVATALSKRVRGATR